MIRSGWNLKNLGQTILEAGSNNAARVRDIYACLPDGAKLGYRLDSKSSVPAIDFQFSGSKTQYKVHLP
jgi:hypothetical protein